MNRLSSGRDASRRGENYTYDSWGNLYQTSAMSGLAGNSWYVSANGNNRLSNLAYDSAGDVTRDQFNNAYTSTQRDEFGASGRTAIRMTATASLRYRKSGHR